MLFYNYLLVYVARQRLRLDALAVSNIPERGVIAGVFAASPERDRSDTYSVTHPVDQIEVDALGVMGDRHRCATRGSSGRESSLYVRGTPIRQHRHLCAVSTRDCEVLSERLGVEVTPALLGANLLLDRVDGVDFSLSLLPPGTHLLVLPAGATEVPRPPLATLVHYVRQQGCGITGRAIAERYGDPSLVKRFREVSTHHRGIICSVEHPVQTTAGLRAGLEVVFRFPTAVAP